MDRWKTRWDWIAMGHVNPQIPILTPVDLAMSKNWDLWVYCSWKTLRFVPFYVSYYDTYYESKIQCLLFTNKEAIMCVELS